jgi:hypothetical protein
VIPMVEVAANEESGLTKLFTLLNENLQFSDATKGTIQLNLKWLYDPKYDEEIIVKRRSALDLLRKSMKAMRKVVSKAINGQGDSEPLLKKEGAAGAGVKHSVGEDEEALDAAHEDETNEMTPFELELFLKEQARKRKLEMKDILEVITLPNFLVNLLSFSYEYDRSKSRR